jgi:hypothetical protein
MFRLAQWPARAARFGLAFAAIAVSAPLLTGCVARERVYVAGPPRRVVVVESRPGLVWVPGHWVRYRGGEVWVEGHWRRI